MSCEWVCVRCAQRKIDNINTARVVVRRKQPQNRGVFPLSSSSCVSCEWIQRIHKLCTTKNGWYRIWRISQNIRTNTTVPTFEIDHTILLVSADKFLASENSPIPSRWRRNWFFRTPNRFDAEVCLFAAFACAINKWIARRRRRKKIVCVVSPWSCDY